MSQTQLGQRLTTKGGLWCMICFDSVCSFHWKAIVLALWKAFYTWNLTKCLTLCSGWRIHINYLNMQNLTCRIIKRQGIFKIFITQVWTLSHRVLISAYLATYHWLMQTDLRQFILKTVRSFPKCSDFKTATINQI